MSNPFREAMESMVNDKIGASSNKTVAGLVTYVNQGANGADWCTVCPIDMDAIWDLKSYYVKTKIDRTAAQGTIDRVRLNPTGGLIAETVAVGDRVMVAYYEDRPYILQKVSQADKLKVQNRRFMISETETSVYDWIYGDAFGAFSDQNNPNPLPATSAAGEG